MLVPVNEPKITAAHLRQPYMAEIVFGISFPVDRHYFCEGDGVTAMGLTADWARENWLKEQQNPWWKRMFGAAKYKIPMREKTKTHDDIYLSFEVLTDRTT